MTVCPRDRGIEDVGIFGIGVGIPWNYDCAYSGAPALEPLVSGGQSLRASTDRPWRCTVGAAEVVSPPTDGRMALLSTDCESQGPFPLVLPEVSPRVALDGGWQLLNCFNSLSCADACPTNISVTAAASASTLNIAMAFSNGLRAEAGMTSHNPYRSFRLLRSAGFRRSSGLPESS